LSNAEQEAEELEVNVSTLTVMRQKFGSRSAAFAYLLFILIYIPCVAVVGVIYRETNFKWTLFSILYLTVLAWLVSVLFFQISQFSGQPGTSFFWIAICLLGCY
jgi:ferrous iron transport protein B